MSGRRRIEAPPGTRFGRWTVISEAEKGKRSERRFVVKCDCGSPSRVVALQQLSHGTSQSCGCLHREAITKHGLSKHPLYTTWYLANYRCHSEKSPDYPDYGGRGISVYPEWRDSPKPFIEWVEANLGPRPEGESLDRVNVDGNYEPGNLRWATWKVQAANQRRVIKAAKVDDLTAKNANLAAKNAELQAENAELKKQLAELTA